MPPLHTHYLPHTFPAEVQGQSPQPPVSRLPTTQLFLESLGLCGQMRGSCFREELEGGVFCASVSQ